MLDVAVAEGGTDHELENEEHSADPAGLIWRRIRESSGLSDEEESLQEAGFWGPPWL